MIRFIFIASYIVRTKAVYQVHSSITRTDANMRIALQLSPDMLQSHRFQLLYWLNPQEQWARAYAQFIAVRSGDNELLQEIERSRDLDEPSVVCNIQWEFDDFAQVSAAIETAFQKLGWML